MSVTESSNEKDSKSSKLFVLISCMDGKIDSALNKIRQIDLVTGAQKTDGAYDIIAILEAESNEDLKKTLMQKIRTINDIKYTLTLRSNMDDGALS